MLFPGVLSRVFLLLAERSCLPAAEADQGTVSAAGRLPIGKEGNEVAVGRQQTEVEPSLSPSTGDSGRED